MCFLNDPWGSPVEKCHPRIAACGLVVPAASHYGFVAPDKPLSLTDGTGIRRCKVGLLLPAVPCLPVQVALTVTKEPHLLLIKHSSQTPTDFGGH